MDGVSKRMVRVLIVKIILKNLLICFKRMEIADFLMKVLYNLLAKKTTRADANHAGHIRHNKRKIRGEFITIL